MIETMAPFTTTLRRLRTQRGLSQGDLAERAGLSRGYLIRLEQGRQDPTLSVLRRLAKGLHISITSLVR
jgi:transcriptional regulator with XRE-family HTH domain